MSPDLTGSRTQPLVGDGARPWAEWAEIFARTLRLSTAQALCQLLMRMLEVPEALTSTQRRDLNAASRRLLEFAWAQDPMDTWLSANALVSVCRSFAGGPEESAALIRRSLAPDHLARWGAVELPRLADEVRRLCAFAPELVEDIYRTAFSYEERSTAETQMYASQILPLRSNRRQDYDIGLFTLAEAFPAFLDAALVFATRSLIAVADAGEQGNTSAHDAAEAEFTFRGRFARTRLREDLRPSFGSTYLGDMLRAFQVHLEGLDRADAAAERSVILDLVAMQNRSGAVWRLLLLIGASCPQTWGVYVRELGRAVPILTGLATSAAAGDYLAATFEHCDTADRERIEKAVLSIADSRCSADAEDNTVARRIRDRLLSRLPVSAVVTTEVRNLRMQVSEPTATAEELWAQADIADDGFIGADDPLIASLLEKVGRHVGLPVPPQGLSASRVQEFIQKYINEVPGPLEVNTILPDLEEMYLGLTGTETAPDPFEQRTTNWGHLAQACTIIARSEGLDCETTTGTFVRRTLLEASRDPEPEYRPEIDEYFDEHAAWNSPAPRVDAAIGLLQLTRSPACADRDVLDAIEQLSQDQVPSVRMQVGLYAARLYSVDPERMWRILVGLCHHEPRLGVLRMTVEGALRSLFTVDANRVGELVRTVYHRVVEGPGAQQTRHACLPLLIHFYIVRDEAACRSILFEIAQNPLEHAREAKSLSHFLREAGALACGPIDPPDPEREEMRHRGLELFHALVRSTVPAGRGLLASYAEMSTGRASEAIHRQMKAFLELVGSLGKQIYFASGAHDAQRQRPTPSLPLLCRYLREITPSLDDLAELGLAPVAHDLIQTLAYLLSCDPPAVFRRVGSIVKSSADNGYQSEAMGADLIVQIVERVLAEHRPMLREDVESRRVLIELLDAFVRAGWPQARRLTTHLEEIFR